MLKYGFNVRTLVFASEVLFVVEIKITNDKYSGKVYSSKICLHYALMAQKACAVSNGHEWRDVFKDPVTDPGKVSRKGNQRTENMKLRYDCGTMYNIDSFSKIQQRILSVT